jgi:hypothetical protein
MVLGVDVEPRARVGRKRSQVDGATRTNNMLPLVLVSWGIDAAARGPKKPVDSWL